MNTERTITLCAAVWLFVEWLKALRELRRQDVLINDMRLKFMVSDAPPEPDVPGVFAKFLERLE